MYILYLYIYTHRRIHAYTLAYIHIKRIEGKAIPKVEVQGKGEVKRNA